MRNSRHRGDYWHQNDVVPGGRYMVLSIAIVMTLTVGVIGCRKTGTPRRKTIHIGNGVTMDFVLIPAGTFSMGSPDSEKGRDSDEGPVQTVQITKAFYMSKYEVTQDQYMAVMARNPSFVRVRTFPVDGVAWDDAVTFCSEVGGRLPTEAEWEYACRAGSSSRYFWGDYDSGLDEYVWHARNSGYTTHRVGQKRPNTWGLYDMCGNVWEWCQDWYATSYQGASSTDPKGPSSGEKRVSRGGSSHDFWDCARSANREGFTPGKEYEYLGFRVVLDSPALTNSVGLELVYVEPGSFQMAFYNDNGTIDEIHTVRISRGFLIGKYEVTQAQYEAAMGTNPSGFKRWNLPVEKVTWFDAMEFCRKWTEREQRAGHLPDGCVYRLPTEAEWEYAARGGARRQGFSYAGSNTVEEVAWCEGNSEDKTHAVGQKKPNELGVYDMSGNVSEWCQDWYSHKDIYGENLLSDPTGPSAGDDRVVRGGSWHYSPGCHLMVRFRGMPQGYSNDVGFRVVVSFPLD